MTSVVVHGNLNAYTRQRMGSVYRYIIGNSTEIKWLSDVRGRTMRQLQPKWSEYALAFQNTNNDKKWDSFVRMMGADWTKSNQATVVWGAHFIVYTMEIWF